MGPTTRSENAINSVLDAVVAAHAARDAHAILAEYHENAVRYTLAPPLQQRSGTAYGDVAGLDTWLATFDGPVHIEHLDRQITSEGDVAFAHMLSQMTATPAGARATFSFWYRTTVGLQRTDGRWQIVHHHDSTPFHMDGSFRAATDLEPPVG